MHLKDFFESMFKPQNLNVKSNYIDFEDNIVFSHVHIFSKLYMNQFNCFNILYYTSDHFSTSVPNGRVV